MSKPEGQVEFAVNQQASIFPNPTQGKVEIHLASEEAHQTTVQVFDMSGRLVQTVQAQHEPGSQVMQLDLSALANGMYHLHVKFDNTLILTEKLSKSN
ncbi:MAG: T9SS type A sorting domain-containing protein [Bacteroidota bacterium]|nr:MAG: T9SS type A sorting domain-containing protein [Bacteroidota bacterium]